jgi:hypothetical protein
MESEKQCKISFTERKLFTAGKEMKNEILTENHLLHCEFLGYHGGEVSSRGLLCCDAV